MAANIVTIGLASIKLGDIESDGGMGTSLAAVGYTKQDTCKLSVAEGTITDYVPEEIDDPIFTSQKAGEKMLEFTLMDASVDTITAILGGSVTTTGTTPNQVFTWGAPATIPDIEQSIEVTPTEGLKLEITRAKIIGSIDAPFSKNGLFELKVKAKILKPTKSGEMPYRFIQNE